MDCSMRIPMPIPKTMTIPVTRKSTRTYFGSRWMRHSMSPIHSLNSPTPHRVNRLNPEFGPFHRRLTSRLNVTSLRKEVGNGITNLNWKLIPNLMVDFMSGLLPRNGVDVVMWAMMAILMVFVYDLIFRIISDFSFLNLF